MKKSKLPGLIKVDSWLTPMQHEIEARIERFETRLNEIEKYSGSIAAFASGYKYYGIHFDKKNNCFVYREWAPAAHMLFLTGEFNSWNMHSHPMYKNESGDWEIMLDYDQYKETFKHGSHIKVLVHSNIGVHYRIPAYINRVIQDEYSKDFSGQVWFEKPFDWKSDTFMANPKEPLFIYEAHVGMAQEKHGLGTFTEFTENVLPRIKDLGYNAIQLMAIQEHPYYGSFGYHVANFFAVSSRFGTPEELKTLIKTAHSMGIAVIMDLVHSHTVRNINEGLNLFDGTEAQYFHEGDRGNHPDWDSKLFNYGKPEVQQFLLSNIQYWLKEFHFDGFRFDGVGSMMYFHHGNTSMDSIDKFFTDGVEWDAITYLQLANYLARKINKNAITIAEDVTGMPGLTLPPADGGIGFDYRLGMGIPDFWIRYLKDSSDEEWDIYEMWQVMNDRLPYVKTVSYAESHDQALVGDKTIAFWLMDKEMYFHMHVDDPDLIIERGIALHKMIRLFTIALGGQAYLTFMGNEFGHPEWIDFPRLGNNWSYDHARRQWSLADDENLKYKFLLAFDKAMIHLVKEYHTLDHLFASQLNMDPDNKSLAFERNGLVFVFNFHTNRSITNYSIPVNEGGDYEIVLCTDSQEFGGQNRIDTSILYPASFNPLFGRDTINIYLTNRTALVFKKKQK